MTKKQAVRKKLYVLMIVGACITVSFAAGIFAVGLYQAGKCVRLAKTLTVPDLRSVQFVLYGSGGDTVSARFRLNDADGHEIALIERSWNGRELFIDFIAVRMAEKTFQFPFLIYSDERQNDLRYSGTYLPGYYLTDDCCRLFFYEEQTAADREAFLQISRYILNSVRFFSRGVRVDRNAVSLNSCERGVMYTIITDSSGQLFLLEE